MAINYGTTEGSLIRRVAKIVDTPKRSGTLVLVAVH